MFVRLEFSGLTVGFVTVQWVESWLGEGSVG